MKPEKESPPVGNNTEEVADTLTAISVVARQLATKIRTTTNGEKDNGNKNRN